MLVPTCPASWFLASRSLFAPGDVLLHAHAGAVPRKKRLLLSYLLPVKGISTFGAGGGGLLLPLQPGVLASRRGGSEKPENEGGAEHRHGFGFMPETGVRDRNTVPALG